MLSHVVATVLRCEKATATHATPCKTTTDSDVVTHVTLSDGAESDDLLGMGGSATPGRTAGAVPCFPAAISRVLLRSMHEGSHVLVTHVLSRSARPAAVGGDGCVHGRESLVLAPTKDTTATVLTEEHPYYPTSTRGVQNPFASQPLTAERASQLFSLTQQHSSPMTEDIATKPQRGLIAVVAPLRDIIADGVATSLMEGEHWRTPRELSRFLTNAPSVPAGLGARRALRPSYRSATLLLEPSRVSRDVVMHADSDALKLLCLDVPIEDVVDVEAPDNPCLRHVGELLRALCSEDAPIRWVLEQESEFSWFVANATLLRI